MRVIRTEHVRAPSSHAAWIEVVYEAPDAPGRWRRTLAAFLIRLAGKIARMRVRVVER